MAPEPAGAMGVPEDSEGIQSYGSESLDDVHGDEGSGSEHISNTGPSSSMLLSSGDDAVMARSQSGGRMRCEAVGALPFPVALADASQPGCPVVSCSASFAAHAGFATAAAAAAAGSTWQHLLQQLSHRAGATTCVATDDGSIAGVGGGRQNTLGTGVPIVPQQYCQLFEAAVRGDYYALDDQEDGWTLPSGELVCYLAGAGWGDFGTLLHLKQVELNDDMFVVILLEQVGPDDDGAPDVCGARRVLDRHLTRTEKALAPNFWYSAPMRRQVAEDSDW